MSNKRVLRIQSLISATSIVSYCICHTLLFHISYSGANINKEQLNQNTDKFIVRIEHIIELLSNCPLRPILERNSISSLGSSSQQLHQTDYHWRNVRTYLSEANLFLVPHLFECPEEWTSAILTEIAVHPFRCLGKKTCKVLKIQQIRHYHM